MRVVLPVLQISWWAAGYVATSLPVACKAWQYVEKVEKALGAPITNNDSAQVGLLTPPLPLLAPKRSPD